MVFEQLNLISRNLGLLLAFALLLVCSANSHPVDLSAGQDQRQAKTIAFDGYRWGIHIYQVRIENNKVTVRKKDLEKNSWLPAVTGTLGDLTSDDDFRFFSGLSSFPPLARQLSSIKWSELEAVRPANMQTVYTKHRSLSATVDGKDLSADYWAQKDSEKRTMDLVIDEDDQVIAAVDPTNDAVLVQPGFEAFTTVGEWRDPTLSQPLYGYRALDKAMIPTRAGPKLATLVYLPEGDIDGPYPTVLIRTPYGISDIIDSYKHYPIRGFALVIQAAQGTIYWDPENRSEGAHQTMVNEPSDGADTLNWIVDQPWSNGSICMQGGSYLGYTQWTSTIARNPALKCLIPEVSMGTAFSDQPYMGGTFVQGFAYYVFWMLNKELQEGRRWSDVFRHRPIIDMDRYATGEDIPLWNDVIENASNNQYWRGQNWYKGEHTRSFGTLQISGWFDDDYPGTRSNWALMSAYGDQPNRLVLGPWRHGYNRDRKLNGYSYGPDAIRDDIWLLKQRWYDYFLKGIDNGVADTSVDYFVLGSNEWRTAKAWPPLDASNEAYYFHSSGYANQYSDEGLLLGSAPKERQRSEQFVYDPKNAVKNWYSFELMKRWSDYQSYPYDFKDIETREDVVTFTTAPLEEDLTIAGNIKVVLYASTDVKDTDWWAYISDVAPDYSSSRLSVGALRARFRNMDDPNTHIFGSNFEKEELLSGDIDDVVRYEIAIPSVANTFKKGHRVRIAIMNAHENYSFPNSNTGQHEGHVVETIPAQIRIHHSKEHPSHVLLPVMPSN